MSFIDAARHRLRTLLRPAAVDRERDEEFAFHQSLAEGEHADATGDASDARYAARRAFGNVASIKEDVRWMGATRWIDQLGQDLRFASRTLRRSPVFAIVATLSIGLSIGANAAVFGVINALMLERLAIRQPTELVQIWREDGAGGREPYFTAAEFDALKTAAGLDVSFMTNASALHAEINGTSYSRLGLTAVDGGLFPMLGVVPAAGRLLTPDDDRTAAPVAVLGFASAVRYFGSPRDAAGQQITLQGHTFTIVGVLPHRFRGLYLEWPMTIVVTRNTSMQLLRNTWNPRDSTELTLVARLRAGAEQQTRMSLDGAFAGCCAKGELLPTDWGTIGPFRGDNQRLGFSDISRGIPAGKLDMRVMFGRLLYTLMAGVAIVLLIACTNVGNLLLARATVRSRELAVRMSLGASRGRIVRQLLAESMLVAAVGAIAGIVLAVWGTAALAENLPGILSVLEPFVAITPNPAVITFTAAVAVACTLVFGVVPAIRATRIDPVVDLRNGAPSSTRSGRLDRGIIAFQMALALVLVASVGLLGATLRNLRSGIGDMHPDRLLVAEVDSAGTSIPRGGERAAYDRILERLRTVPGVSSVSGTEVMPLVYMGFSTRTLDIPGFEHLNVDRLRPEDNGLGAGIIFVTPGFFATTGTGLVSGREFTDADVPGAPPAVIINEAIARQFFQGRDPIGQHIGFRGGGRALQIIGVARDVKQTDLRAPNPRTVYLARAQRRNDGDRFTFAMRTVGSAASSAPGVRAAIAAAAPEVFIRSVQPMAELVSFSVGREQALRAVAIVFSTVAVGLAAIGLYGVMAFHVTSRRREIGIRMALGADRREVVSMVMRQSLFVVAAGIALGVPLALGASSALGALLYGVSPFTTGPFVIAVAVLVGTGVIAALIPSRNASRVDPMTAIRAE
ncbi:MAG TPA: ABC transporter permease [Vicinamibacterales bacterium]|jgi:predicted permease